MNKVICGMILAIMCYVGIIGGIIYVTWHFIAKFW